MPGRVRQIRWIGNSVEILDQTQLPSRENYLRLRSLPSFIEAIKMLRVRGAPLIGITAAYAMALSKNPKRDAKRLIAARPTAVNLQTMVERMLPHPTLAEARRIHEEDIEMCDAMARNGARLFRRGARIMTICNTGALATGGVGTAFGVLLKAKAKVFALETRPLCQGARLTMWEAMKNKMDATLIPDGASGSVMRDKGIQGVITGADRITANGDTANKIGTYNLAVLAREHQIPFYIAAPASTFDMKMKSGKQIPIEERDPDEMRTNAPRKAKVYNPAFDMTPARLITAIVTDRGVLRPPYGTSIRKRIERAR